MKDKIHKGHVLDVLRQLPSDCVDMAVTSSPYYGQRFYGKETNVIWDGDANCKHEWEYYVSEEKFEGEGREVLKGKQADEEHTRGNRQGFCGKCGAWFGGLGNEPTPALFIKHLVDIYSEVRRVLKPTGLFFCNIGDSSCGSQSGYGTKIPNPRSLQSPMKGFNASAVMKPVTATCVGAESWLKPKQLMLIPSRLAIAMQEDGWMLRRDIIWWKKSALPSPVLDNFGSEYEHIFMFSKEPYYFFDNGKARRPYNPVSIKRQQYTMTSFGTDGLVKCSGSDKSATAVPVFIEPNPKGALKGDVWRMGTANTKYKHTAAFSEELVESCLLPGCAREVCSVCGAPKMEKYKMMVRQLDELNGSEKYKYRQIQDMTLDPDLKEKILLKLLRRRVSLGFLQMCDCKDNSYDSGIVLDPFCGTGTTAVTAKKLGYHYCGIELNSEYYDIIETRLREML